MTDVRPIPSAQVLRRGVSFGLCAGVVGGIAWFLVVLGTTSMTTYLIPALGIAVAYGVHLGMHRPGRKAAVVSVSITAVTVALSLYYVERHLIVTWFSDNGDNAAIPLVPYLDWIGSVLRHAFRKSPAAAVYTVLALVVGGWFGFRGFTHEHRPDTPVVRGQ
ncbi:MAG: hypothetical protein WCK21_02490 [Actinomycetota bacterium]